MGAEVAAARAVETAEAAEVATHRFIFKFRTNVINLINQFDF